MDVTCSSLDQEEQPSLMADVSSTVNLSDYKASPEQQQESGLPAKVGQQNPLQVSDPVAFTENFYAVLVALLTKYFEAKPSALDDDFLELLGHFINAPEEANILLHYQADLVTRNIATIHSEAPTFLNWSVQTITAWKRDFYPSLVGSYKQPFDEENFNTVVNMLHQLVLERQAMVKNLEVHRKKEAEELTELGELLQELLDEDLSEEGRLMMEEVESKYELLQTKRRLNKFCELQAPQKAMPKRGTIDEFAQLTVENEKLQKQLTSLQETKKVIDSFDQTKVAKAKELYEQICWAKNIANGKRSQ